MAHLVIISENKQISEVLSDIISRELPCDVTILTDAETINQLPEHYVDVMICTQPDQVRDDIPYILLSSGKPKKIQHILEMVEQKISAGHHGAIPLTEHITLIEKKRALQHSLTGDIVELTEKEYALLQLLHRRKHVSKEAILKEIWGMSADIDTHTLQTHIYRLRQKWRELSDKDIIIASEKGYGFDDGSND